MFNRYVFNRADIQVEKAKEINPNILARMIARKKAILVTGGKLLEDELLADLAAEIALRGRMDVFATGGSSKPLIERGIKPKVLTLHHLTQMILDSSGFFVFLGFEPYLLSRALSSIKHFSKAVTVSIDRWYQPNARLSFPDCDNYGLLETLVSCLR